MFQGGCLCGAVRWTAEGTPKAVHCFHCSKCRRWTATPFATLAWFGRGAVQWTGTPAVFRSSRLAVRTHCGACGTPLSLAYDERMTWRLRSGLSTSRTPHADASFRRRKPGGMGRNRTGLPDKATRER